MKSNRLPRFFRLTAFCSLLVITFIASAVYLKHPWFFIHSDGPITNLPPTNNRPAMLVSEISNIADFYDQVEQFSELAKSDLETALSKLSSEDYLLALAVSQSLANTPNISQALLDRLEKSGSLQVKMLAARSLRPFAQQSDEIAKQLWQLMKHPDIRKDRYILEILFDGIVANKTHISDCYLDCVRQGKVLKVTVTERTHEIGDDLDSVDKEITEEWLNSRWRLERSIAFRALGHIGPEANAAVPILEKIVSETSLEFTDGRHARAVLAAILPEKYPPELIKPVLIEYSRMETQVFEVEYEEVGRNLAAVNDLMFFVPQDKQLRNVLLLTLKDSDLSIYVRETAAQGLAKFGARDPEAQSAIIHLLKIDDEKKRVDQPIVRGTLYRTLAGVSSRRDDSFQYLEKELIKTHHSKSHYDLYVRIRILDALLSLR